MAKTSAWSLRGNLHEPLLTTSLVRLNLTPNCLRRALALPLEGVSRSQKVCLCVWEGGGVDGGGGFVEGGGGVETETTPNATLSLSEWHPALRWAATRAVLVLYKS